MPNGYDLPEETFNKLELPLRRIDAVVKHFAEQIDGTVERNYHGQPSRSVLVEGADGITRKLQISPGLFEISRGWQKGNYCYGFAAMAWKDVKGGRLLSPAFVKELREDEVMAILQSCWEEISKLDETALKFTPVH